MAGPAETAWRRRAMLGLSGVALFSIYLTSSTLPKNSRQNVDTLSALIPAWSLGQRGTLHIPEYLQATPWIQQHGDVVLSDRMPGIILWATPFYGLFGSPSGPSVGVAALAAVAATSLAIVLLFRVFTRVLDPAAALVAAGIGAFGTATWTVSANALWPHGIDQLWIAVAMLMLAKDRYWFGGLAFAASIMTRPHLAVSAAICGIWAGIHRRSPYPTLQVGLTSVLGLLGLLAYNQSVFGRAVLLAGVYSERPSTARATVSAAEHDYGLTLAIQVAGSFISPLRGLFVLSPFLLLLLPGLRRAWVIAPTWIRSSAVAGLAYMGVQLMGNGFQGGSYFYSYRLPIELLTLAAPLLALAWREWTVKTIPRQVAFAALAIVSVIEHAIGAFIFIDTLDFETRAWSRFQVAEGLGQATNGQLVGLGGLSIACTALSFILIKHGRVTSSLSTREDDGSAATP